MEPIADLGLLELGVNLVAIIVVIAVAWFLWRILKRIIGGCISAGVGCLVVLAGLAAIAYFFASQNNINSLQDLLRLLGL
jgi:beta-lactamase regulating signal transducer with metallopeptidase domain